MSAPNPIKDIYKKIVFFDIDSPLNPFEFQYTDSISLDDIPISNVKNYFVFDNQIKFDATVIGPTDNYTYPMDMTQLASDIYGGAQPAAGDHLPNLGGISSTHWSITNGSLIECLVGEKNDRVAKDTELDNELNQIERLITGSSTGWAHDDYQAAGQTQNPYVEGAGGALMPATQYIDNGTENITGNAAGGLIDADQILDQEIHHNRTWLETLQNMWDGADGVGSAPAHPSGNGATNNTVGTFNNTYIDIGTGATETPKYIADIQNVNAPRPGTGNTTLAEATSIKDALLRLDDEIHKNESWLSELHEALYGADDILDDSGGNVVGEAPRDNVLQNEAATKVTFREFGSGKDHDSWGRHGNTNSGSYLTKDLVAVGTSTEGAIGRVNSFSQAIAELDYQIKNLWDRRDLDHNGFLVSQGAQSANAQRISLTEISTDLNSFCSSVIGTDLGDRNSSLPTYTPTVGNSYTGGIGTLRDQIDSLDAQLQHLTDAVQNADTGALAWSSDVGAGSSVLEDVNSLHSELDATQAGVGLNADGSYPASAGSYTSGNATIKEDIADLEARLDILDGLITGAPNSTYSTDIGNTGDGALEADINWVWDTLWEGGGSAGTHSIASRVDEIISVGTGSKEIKLNQNLNSNNKQIKSLAAGTANDDAATYGQLQLAQAGFTPGYAAKVATQQIVDSASLMADLPSQAGGPYTAPAGGLMAIDTSHTLANYNNGDAKTWDNKDNITLDGTDYEHGGIAYDSDLAPKTITTSAVYIDGIELEDGDYVLVTGEALAAVDGATWRESTQTGEYGWHWRNGIWIFRPTTVNGGVWERPSTDILWESGTGVGLGQCHPVRQGYQNGLCVFESCAATVGSNDPAYPIESCATETQANAAALYAPDTNRVVSAWCIFTGIQSIGSGNATSLRNYNEVWIDYDVNQFQVTAGSPDYLALKLQASTTSYAAGTDMVPLHVDASGVGLQVDNDFFEFDTGAGVNRLTLKSNQPIIGENINLNAGGLVYNTSGFEDRLGLGTNSPGYTLHVKVDDDTESPILFIENDGNGDASMRFGLTGIENYAIGIDHDDSDKFKISNSSALGTNPRLTIDSNGKVGIGVTDPDRMLEVGTGGMRVDLDWSSPISGVSITASAGGWARGFNAINGIEDTRLASFYHYGDADVMNRSGLSTNYDDPQGLHYDWSEQSFGINTLAPDATLHIANSNDISLTSSTSPFMVGAGNDSANLIMDCNEIITRNNNSAATLYINNYSDGEVRIGKGTGHASLGIGQDPSNTSSLVMRDDSGGGGGIWHFDMSSVSSGYTSMFKMDDTALHLGHNSIVRDIHIKCDYDGTPKGIEIEPTGVVKTDGYIYENGTQLSDLYGSVDNGTMMPTGAIIMWSGTVASVPAG